MLNGMLHRYDIAGRIWQPRFLKAASVNIKAQVTPGTLSRHMVGLYSDHVPPKLTHPYQELAVSTSDIKKPSAPSATQPHHSPAYASFTNGTYPSVCPNIRQKTDRVA